MLNNSDQVKSFSVSCPSPLSIHSMLRGKKTSSQSIFMDGVESWCGKPAVFITMHIFWVVVGLAPHVLSLPSCLKNTSHISKKNLCAYFLVWMHQSQTWDHCQGDPWQNKAKDVSPQPAQIAINTEWLMANYDRHVCFKRALQSFCLPFWLFGSGSGNDDASSGWSISST